MKRAFRIQHIYLVFILSIACLSFDNHQKSSKIYDFLDKYNSRKPPILDSTNFDNFTFRNTLSKDQVSLLKLDSLKLENSSEIYVSYKLNLSPNFKSIVITYLPRETALETILINYDNQYNLIDSKIIAYDEIAESCLRKMSRINVSKIEITVFDFCNKTKRIRLYNINTNWKIITSH